MRLALALVAAFAVGCAGEESEAPAVDASDESIEDVEQDDFVLDAETDDAERDVVDSSMTTDTLVRDTRACSEPDNGVSADASDGPDGAVFACWEISCSADQACVTHISEGDASCPAWAYANCIPLDPSCDVRVSCACAFSTSPLPCGPSPRFTGCAVDPDGHVIVMC